MTKLSSGNAAAAAGMSVGKAEPSPRPLWTLTQLSPGLVLPYFR